MDNGEYIIGIFLDITNLNINTSGIRGTPLFVALTNRKQYVYYNRTNSEIFNITCGIPQDSVSGPLSVFNCYQWHWFCIYSKLSFTFVANDTNIFKERYNVVNRNNWGIVSKLS